VSQRFLGLDASTQSLSAVVIDYDRGDRVHEHSVNFDQALPQYGTRSGVLPNADPGLTHAPPLMWIEALDLLLLEMADQGVDLHTILAVAGSGQQHGSVYLNASATAALSSLDPSRSPAGNLGAIFARPTAPIWMDGSTTAQCGEIRDALGGRQATAELTGSDTCERFTGPQIRKFFQQEPQAYAATTHICLVSSFMASLLGGAIAPIEPGDGAGMNLMDLRTRQWHTDALDATAPELRRRLPPLVPSDSVIGRIAPYFSKRYGLSPDTLILPWSGDNPSSLVGVGLVRPGMVAISLGTSDTYFGYLREPYTDPAGLGHVFGAPTGDYMSLICFQNGSLARERVRDAYRLDWRGFSRALHATEPGNQGGIMLPYFGPEIVPRVLQPAVHRFGGLREDDAARNCRAVVEGQMMSMRNHAAWMGERPTKILATGGGSSNRQMLQIMANVHGCPVYRFDSPNSAALGAALRAAHGYLKHRGLGPDWRAVVSRFTDPEPGSEVLPDPQAVRVYDRLTRRYAEYEARVSEG
jgi:xylulokinase